MGWNLTTDADPAPEETLVFRLRFQAEVHDMIADLADQKTDIPAMSRTRARALRVRASLIEQGVDR